MATDKNFVVKNGLTIGTSEVITSAGNLTNIGNITLSGTVDGVDIASRDSVLTSTTTTANAALPKAGGTMTGDINMNVNDITNIKYLSFDNREITDFTGAYQMLVDANDTDSNVPNHGNTSGSGPFGIYFTGDGGNSTTTLGSGLVKVWHTGHFTKDHIDYFVGLYNTGVTTTEFDYLDGVTSNIQTALDAKAPTSTTVTTNTTQTISGAKTFTSTIGVNASGSYAIVDNGSVGWSYSPQEGGSAGVRYFLLFNYDNNASYPYLTNRTPSGRVSIYAGTAAGGGENEKIRVNGGDGTTEIDMFGTLDMNSNNITGVGTINSGAINTTGAITIDVDNQADGALRIEANQTNPDNDLYFAQEIYSTLSGTTATTGDREQGGIYMDINSTATGGDTANEHRAYGMHIDLDSTGDADNIYGVFSNVTATPTTGTTTNVYGLYGHAEDNGGAGNVTTLIGVQGTAVSDNATSDVNAMYAGYFKSYNQADSAAISASTAVYGEIEIPSGTADIYGSSYIFQAQYDNNGTVAQTNTTYLYYGNYAGVLPTNAYGVYIADAVDNYFAGNISSGQVISTDSHVQSGDGSGGVALTVNDGYGNANVTFNHLEGVPEQNGNSARIEVNTDATSSATMYFEVASNVTSGVAVQTDNVFGADISGIFLPAGKTIRGSTELTLTADDMDFVVEDNTDAITNFIWRDHSASKLYLGTSTAQVELRSSLNLQSGYSISINGSEVISSAGVYGGTLTSSQVTTALGYTPYQESTALSATTGVFSSSVNIDNTLNLDARYDGGQEKALAFKDSAGNYSISHNVNDGNGNYSISIGYSGAGSGQYAVTNDGVGKILFGGHGRDGAVSLNAAPVGTAGNDISFSIGLLVDGDDNTIRVGASANGTGMDTGAGTKVFDASANAFATSYSIGSNEVISNTRVGNFPDINLDGSIIHTGDTNTYMQFHAADQWRVVTGGSERLEANNTRTTVNNGYLQITGSDSHLVPTTTATASTVRIGKTASTRSAIVLDTSSTATGGNGRIYTIENAAGDRLRIGNPDHPEALNVNSDGSVESSGDFVSTGLTIGSWGVGSNTGQGRIGKASDRSTGVITNQMGTSSGYWEIVDYAWSVVAAQCTNAGDFTAYRDFNSNTGGYKINATTVIDSSRNLTNIAKITGNSSSGGTTTFNVGRGDVYFESNSNSNANGAGITLRTSGNPTTGSIFDVRSSGQACRLFSGQSLSSAGTNPFYIGTPATGNESTGSDYEILLDTNGDITAEGNITAYGTVSDIRQKENIVQIDKPIERLEKIKGITFNYKKKSEDERLMGVIAQDLLEDDILKLAVYEQEDFKADDDDPLKHTYGVRYEHLTAILIEAVKNQQKQIEELKEQVSSLTPKN